MKLEVKNIRKSFGDTEVLHGVSFEVESGKALGLLGRNGAGKTTSIRVLMDVFRCDSGEILMDGEAFDVTKYRVGYLPEERGMYPKKKVSEQLIYFAGLRGVGKKDAVASIKSLLEKLEISEYYDRKLESLSKGNQQKVQLVQTMVGDPDILILDEPFSGLDPVNSKLLKDMVQEEIEKGKMVIFSSHQMAFVEEFCENITIINHGEVCLDGNLNEIKSNYGNNRGMIALSGMNMDECKQFLEEKCSHLVEVEEVKKDFLVIRYIQDKNMFLSEMVANKLDIALYGEYKPQLSDIFVKVAGE